MRKSVRRKVLAGTIITGSDVAEKLRKKYLKQAKEMTEELLTK